jgi:hypothetical protein
VTDGNIEELAQHGLSMETVDQVAENEPRFRRNKKGRPASHQMIGPDDGGKTWTVCMVETEPRWWRPITGWEAAEHEREWWKRSK